MDMDFVVGRKLFRSTRAQTLNVLLGRMLFFFTGCYLWYGKGGKRKALRLAQGPGGYPPSARGTVGHTLWIMNKVSWSTEYPRKSVEHVLWSVEHA